MFYVLPSSDIENIKLGNLTSGGKWFWSRASYTADILNLRLICRLIRPRVVFEIRTLKGYTDFNFGQNTLDDAEIYTLDLPKGRNI